MNEQSITPFVISLFAFAFSATLKLRDDLLLLDLITEVLSQYGSAVVDVMTSKILDEYEVYNLTEDDVDFFYFVCDEYMKKADEKQAVDDLVEADDEEEYFKQALVIIQNLDKEGLVFGEDYSFSNREFLSTDVVYNKLMAL